MCRKHTRIARGVDRKSSACRTATTMVISIQTTVTTTRRRPISGTTPRMRSSPGEAAKPSVRINSPVSAAGGHARQHHHGERLAGGAVVGLDLFVHLRIELCGADHA